jgi:hypothetical protein
MISSSSLFPLRIAESPCPTAVPAVGHDRFLKNPLLPRLLKKVQMQGGA